MGNGGRGGGKTSRLLHYAETVTRLPRPGLSGSAPGAPGSRYSEPAGPSPRLARRPSAARESAEEEEENEEVEDEEAALRRAAQDAVAAPSERRGVGQGGP